MGKGSAVIRTLKSKKKKPIKIKLEMVNSSEEMMKQLMAVLDKYQKLHIKISFNVKIFNKREMELKKPFGEVERQHSNQFI